MSKRSGRSTRRAFLRAGAAAGGALVAGCRRQAPPRAKPPTSLGTPTSGYGERSPFEKKSIRVVRDRVNQNAVASSSVSPLQDLHGIITPSSLHFERHHAGVPSIDPSTHQLMIHGLVDRPLVVTVGELKRLPSESHIYFVECSGNSSSEWRKATAADPQRLAGMTSCSEWTGVPLKLLLQEVGVQSGASWIVAEGADACKMSRSIPLAKAMADVLVAYGQNGEALRPEQGYPLRLIVPGWEGNINVKWVRRIKVVDRAYMTREETSKYTDLLADGRARQFSFVMDAKSIITRPAGGQKMAAPGFHEITGLAWSGRGAITRVDVSVDGGKTWQDASLQQPVIRLAHVRFRLPWRWTGEEAILQSRCTDETGYVQPTREELVAARGLNSNYHYHGIVSWKVERDGRVRSV